MIDIVIWARNGSKYLPQVLERIDQIIPSSEVHRKIFVDDHSVDNTVEIAKQYGWDVFPNPAKGISAGANEALKHVDCQFFVSVEQDVLLAKDWWVKIRKHMDDDRVAVAQGVRLSTNWVLRRIDEYALDRKESSIKSLIETASIDNNIYRTSVIKQIGFPSDGYRMCDEGLLIKKLLSRGFKWHVDRNIVSDHIRPSIDEAIDHACHRLLLSPQECSRFKMFRLFATSLIYGLKVAYSKNCLPAIWIHAKIRWNLFKTSFQK